MIIKNIKGINFKNYLEVQLFPSRSCNILFGSNGSGKTNLLDLIHFSSLGKSYFTIPDKSAIKYGEEFFRVETMLLNEQSEDREELSSFAVSVPLFGKKKIWHNGTLLNKNTDILGLIPLVAIVPDDIELIKGSSIIRRKFIDRVLCQINKNYTEALITYQRTIKQKLAILKSTKSIFELDKDLLDTYTEILYKNGNIINEARTDFIESFRPLFLSVYSDISDGNEDVSIGYVTNFVETTFLDDTQSNIEKDYYSKRVRIGTHRDDLEFLIGVKQVKKYASQGQIKTYIYALKLSEYLYLSHKSVNRPILLLDDIFEKLDKKRLKKLFELVFSDKFGQIFITDTEIGRSKKVLNELNVDYISFHVEHNKITVVDG